MGFWTCRWTPAGLSHSLGLASEWTWEIAACMAWERDVGTRAGLIRRLLVTTMGMGSMEGEDNLQRDQSVIDFTMFEALLRSREVAK